MTLTGFNFNLDSKHNLVFLSYRFSCQVAERKNTIITEADAFSIAENGTLNGFDFSFRFYTLVLHAVKREGGSSTLFYRGKSFSYRFTDSHFRASFFNG